MSIILTPKQAKFVEEYLVDMNATAAARRAGYAEKSAKDIGYENLTKPHIQQNLVRRQKQLQDKIHVRQDRVLLELACLAFYNVQDMVDENNVPLPVHEMSEQTARSIVSIKQTVRETTFTNPDGGQGEAVTTTTEYKMANKDAALDKLGRHFGIYKEEIADKAGRIKIIFNLSGKKE